MTKLNFKKLRDSIQQFEFKKLFIQLGWSHPLDKHIYPLTIDDIELSYQSIAQLSGVIIFQVNTANGQIPKSSNRLKIQQTLAKQYHENVLIFVDNPTDPQQSLWYWVKYAGKKIQPRSHSYFKGQSGDLFLSKIASMSVELQDFDNDGNIALVEVTSRLHNALDIEQVTKKFFNDFAKEHQSFVEHILNIDNDKDRAWYASVLLHRLMFIWFLQKKAFLNKGDLNYLETKLAESQRVLGAEHYYQDFLKPLFFEGFAKPENERSPEVRKLLGKICYLNGGLFLPHQIETRYPQIEVGDAAFVELFALFNRYSWNLDDTPEGKDDEINPDVLGYIFEKYINQKQFGAYYTRPEITEYLCEKSIYQLILDKVNQPAVPELNLPAREFADFTDLLFYLDEPLCRKLLDEVLPQLSLLDPACGSGAFLVAAQKVLLNVYAAIVGKIKVLKDSYLEDWLAKVERDHASVLYFIKKQIIRDNLYGVDIMPEAMEIAKLRLFLSLVSSAQKVEDLEPLPNIDFNIMAGNSLVGLLKVDAKAFEQDDLFSGKSYRQILTEKNVAIKSYKDAAVYSENLLALRHSIKARKDEDYGHLNQLLLREFADLKIQFEQATWDEVKNKLGKPVKRVLTLADIEVLQPFHWGYEFDEVFARGGFDAVITNPPWETFQPNAKEFFADYSDVVSKNKMTIKEFEKQQKELIQDVEIKAAWLNYHSNYSYQRTFFRISEQYKYQVPIVNGRKHGKDVNLYKLFTEQCFNLLKIGGECGLVIPSGIYTDLGAMGLRKLLFNETDITGLFCFENRKTIFEGVDSRFKFVVLTFVKNSRSPIASAIGNNKIAKAILLQSFPAEFMRHEVSELQNFPNKNSLHISTELIKKLSPDSLSIMEFKNKTDVTIAEKMLKFPLLGGQLKRAWNLELRREFNMTDDSYLFKTEKAAVRLPLYEGKMIHQFEHQWGEPRYWVDEAEGRKAILGKKGEDTGQILGYQKYRLAYRAIASSTNERALIATIIPPCFTGNSLNISKSLDLSNEILLVCVSFFNSFVVDWLLRQKVSANINMFYIYQLPIPRLTEKAPEFKPIVERAAALCCTSPEYDDLRAELDLAGFKNLQGLKNREQIRAELDAIIAQLYGLTETELQHILNTFPLVKQEQKDLVLTEFRKKLE